MPLLPLLALQACLTSEPAPEPAPPLDRGAFNQTAVELGLPLFQRADGAIVAYRTRLPWDGDVEVATAAIRSATPTALDPRHEALLEELAAGRVTLLTTGDIPEADAAMIRLLLEAGDRVEDLYHHQLGVSLDAIPADDALARAVFNRNQGPWCETPGLLADTCSATPEPAPRLPGIYPADFQIGDDWCERIPEAARDPFHVAVASGGELVAVPYATHWADEMGAIAALLDRAAAAAPADEAALRAYLAAAAGAFRTNDWFAADAAWAEMTQLNSRWYLRIGPDETYWDPCSEHAGFHMLLARVNRDGIRYQERLAPIKQQLEHHLAELAGPPYAERTVGFDLPEFIDVVVNTGDSREGTGATIGQSLPNWGPVAEAGGRTVAMTNIGTDPDSVASEERSLGAVLCTDTLAAWPREPEPLLLSTILHEAAHNLGPAQEYRVEGQTDSQRFGGPLASMLEELKAQTAALDLMLWLAANGHAEPEEVYPEQVADLAWAMGHIALGLSDGAGNPEPYAHLSAIQLGSFLDAGAVSWHPDTLAANGADQGCFEFHREALPAAIGTLAKEVLRIKATGDRAAAEALRDRYTTEGTEFAALRALLADRLGREPRSSYVYRVELPE